MFPTRQFPATRLRRLRSTDFSRRLVRENRLSPDDFIYPVFITEGKGLKTEIASMPGQYRMSVDNLLHTAEKCLSLGIPAIVLFPAIDVDKKSKWLRKPITPMALCHARSVPLRSAFLN